MICCIQFHEGPRRVLFRPRAIPESPSLLCIEVWGRGAVT